MIAVGIDPGLEGYACRIREGSREGGPRREDFWPTPVRGDGELDPDGFTSLAGEISSLGRVDLVLVERQQAFPGKGPKCLACGKPRVVQGVASSFEGGYGFGLWVGTLTASGFAVRWTRPHEWKGPLGLSSDKALSVAKARALAPGVDFRPLERAPKARVPSHDKAEAYLLAITGLRLLRGGK